MLDLPGQDPTLLALPGMRAALANHDISMMYRLLNSAGVPQRRIAELTGQSQSEGSESLKGRRVMAYEVLVRICVGLGIPREAMGLGWGTYAGDTAADAPGQAHAPGEEDDSDVLRRQCDHLLALAGTAAFGAAVPGVGALLSAPATPRQPMAVPARIGRADVEAIRDVTHAIASAARTVGGQAGPACSLAHWADRCLGADASDPARQALLSALAELHVIAAWCCHDSQAPVQSYAHFCTAVDLAIQAQDSYQACYALRYAATMLLHRDKPTDALKLLQLAELHLAGACPDDPRVAALRGWLALLSELARARGGPVGIDSAPVRSAVARARDGWQPPSLNRLHQQADFDLTTALTYLHLGKLDTAEAMAAPSVRTFATGTHRRGGVLAEITLARLHVMAGEPDAARLAAQAIESVIPTRSSVARLALAALAADLQARPRSDLHELARRARQLAATRG